MAAGLTIAWALLLSALGALDARRMWVRHASVQPIDHTSLAAPRWLLAGLPLATALVLLASWLRITTSPYDVWNGARTAPAVAWARGMPLYYPFGEGPATDFIHGPVAAIVRLPAALAHTPTGAILVADVMNVALFFLPVYFFLRIVGRSRLMIWIAMTAMLGFSHVLPSLKYSAYVVHADAPAVGFAIIACACLLRAVRRPHRALWLAGCAGCAILSAGSKQNLAPILFILPLYALLRLGWRGASLLLVYELAMGIVAGVAAILAFGAAPLLYSMYTIPSRHPWWLATHGLATSLFFGSGFLVLDAALPFGLLVVALLFNSACDRLMGRGRFSRYMRMPYTLPLLVAAIMIPSSIVGRVKQGGMENALTPTTFFIAVSFVAWIARRRLPRMKQSPQPRAAQILNLAMLRYALAVTLGLALLSVNPWHETFQRWQQTMSLQRNPQQQAYQFALAHPQEAYFPWHPLASLMADGVDPVFEYGAVDLKLAGETVTRARIDRCGPTRMKYLVYPPDPQADDLRRTFGEYTHRTPAPGLLGWQVYTTGG